MVREYKLAAIVLGLAAGSGATARVIGRNVPAPAVTAARVAAEVPAGERKAWLDYLDRSRRQMAADRASLPAELHGRTPPAPPLAYAPGPRSMPLDRAPAWYASPEARAIADTVVSFQTPAGGWSKNMNRGGPRRLPGQRYANDAETMDPDRANFDAPEDRFWTFVGSLDNDATITELRFLTRVATALPGAAGAPYRASIVKGIGYLLAAQYPNGGWPQNWPLEGGFHDGITFNDNANAQAMEVLDAVAHDPAYRFVPAATRVRAGAAVRRGLAATLAAQVRQGGRRLGWPQQVDALTLAPISARNYEPRSIASAETTAILLFLMRDPDPSPAVRAAIVDGVAWLRRSAVYGYGWERNAEEGRKLRPAPGAGPLWSRNYDLATGKPIFGDKDKSIHDDVNDISLGRRNGYNWWVTTPSTALAAYPGWARTHGVRDAQ